MKSCIRGGAGRAGLVLGAWLAWLVTDGRVRAAGADVKTLPPAGACEKAADPPGWFALGDPAPPSRSEVTALQTALALDARAQPWFALIDRERRLRVGHLDGDTIQVEPVPGLPARDWNLLALGFQGAEVVVAGLAPSASGRSGAAQLVRRSEQGVWSVSDLVGPCVSSPREVLESSLALDRSGRIFHACIQVQRPPQTYRDPLGMPSPPPRPTAATLRLGYFIGTSWHNLLSRAVYVTTDAVELRLDPRGELDVTAWSRYPDSSSGKLLQLHIDSQLRLSSRPAVDPVYTSPAPTLVTQSGERRLGAFYGNTIPLTYQSEIYRGVLAISDRGEPWRPLVGSWPLGVSAGSRPATAPVLALDSCSAPVVAWNEQGGMLIRRFQNATWQLVGQLAGAGPHGLAVDPHGDVYIGVWDRDPGGWTMHRFHDGKSQAAPPFRYQEHWYQAGVRIDETQLRVDTTAHVSFPLKDRVVGWVLDKERGTWNNDSEKRPELPLPATLPWGTPSPWGAVGLRTALTRDPSGRLFAAWADDERPHVAAWDGKQWSLLDDTLPPAAVRGPLALTASAQRICVAWSSESFTATIFVRCHRL